MSHYRLVLALIVPLAVLTCNEPARVEPGDAVRCCFFVPYDGLAGAEQAEECMPRPVCARPGDDDAQDVCEPLSCKSGDVTPYGHKGPSGTTTVTGNCTFHTQRTTIERGGCHDASPT